MRPPRRGAELATLLLLGFLGLFVFGIALLSLDWGTVAGALTFLALPAALYLTWLVWFLARWVRRE